MANLGESTLQELDDVFDATEPDFDRWTAFVKQKAAARAERNPQFVLGGNEKISFDVEVELVKLPAKQSQKIPMPTAETQVIESQPQPEISKLLESTRRSLSLPPVLQDTSLSCKSPNVACLLPLSQTEVNDTLNGSVQNFLPQLSSTLALEQQPRKQSKLQIVRRSADAAEKAELAKEEGTAGVAGSTEAAGTAAAVVITTEVEGGGAAAEEVETAEEANKAGTKGVAGSTEAAGTAEAPEATPVAITTEIEGAAVAGAAVAGAPKKVGTAEEANKAGTEGVAGSTEAAGTPRAPEATLVAITTEIEGAGSPKEVGTAEEVNEAGVAVSKRVAATAEAPEATAVAITTEVKGAAVAGAAKEAETAEKAECARVTESTGSAAVAGTDVAKLDLLANDDFERSYLANLMQMKSKGNLPLLLQRTTLPRSSPARQTRGRQSAECQKEALAEISNSQLLTTPVKVRLKRLKLPINVPTSDPHQLEVEDEVSHVDCMPSREALLDLHITRSNILDSNLPKKAVKSVLNKPACAAINGEGFAQELMRLSHNEILDLRKRNSMGLFGVNYAQQRISKEQQIEVEQRIESELIRRKTADNIVPLAKLTPLKSVLERPNESVSSSKCMSSSIAAPLEGEQRLQRTQKIRNSCSRAKHPKKPMSEELENYLKLSQTIEMRLRTRSSNMSKRSLYTKGDSDVEENRMQSPIKKRRLTFREIEIAPAPPKVTASNDEIYIVPPPPASMRYSQAMCQSRRSKRFMSDDWEETEVQREEVQQLEVHREEEKQHDEQQQAGQQKVQQQEVPQEKVQQKKLQQKEEQQEQMHLEEQQQIEELQQTEVQKEELQQTEVQKKELQQEKAQLKQMHAAKSAHKPMLRRSNQMEQQQEDPSDFLPPADESSMQMEALRMATPTPPPTLPLSTPLPSICDQNLLSEAPSTSKAARKALELSLSSQQKPKKQVKAGRPRKNVTKDNAVSKLPENDLTQGNNNIRRSKRGHVPLRNTWSHTIADPFAYMRDILIGNISKKETAKKKLTVNGTLKRKHRQQEEINGGRTQQQETEFRARAKKRVRIENEELTESVPAAEIDVPLTQTNEVLVVNEDVDMQLNDIEPLPLDVQPNKQDFPLISWLRGIDNNTLDTNAQVPANTDSMIISSLRELEFTNLGGIEYAFYSSGDVGTFGYMRLQALQQRGLNRNKSECLSFIALHGQFKVESSYQKTLPMDSCVLNAGDKIVIKQGSWFNITNLLNEVGILTVSRK